MTGMTGMTGTDLSVATGRRCPPRSSASTEVLVHVTAALTAHARRVHACGGAVPPLVDELAALLLECVRSRPGTTVVSTGEATSDDAAVTTRLLLTKAEAAARLGVSVRTVERLVAAGRLPLVRVEGAPRLRVADVEAFVADLVPVGTAPAAVRRLDT